MRNIDLVKPIKSNKPTKLTLIILIVLLLNSLSSSLETEVLAQNKAKSNKPTPSSRLSYSLDIDISNRETEVITLALDAITIIHCPEPPTQVLVGNETSVAMKETLPSQTDIYITAVKPDVVSNLVIEFKHAKSVIHFRTRNVEGGPLPGTYTGEVFVKPNKVNSELAETQKEVQKLNQQVTKLQAELTQAQKDANEKLAQALTQNSTDLLKLLEQAAIRDKLIATKPIEANLPNSHKGHIKITQVSHMLPSSKGNIVIFSLENDSKDSHSLDAVKSNDATVLTTFTSKSLTPGIYTYIAVLIDASNSTTFDKEVLFIVDTVPVKVKIT